MPDAEFGEGQFEQDLVCELRGAPALSGTHFRPTPGLENHLGFDVAVHVHPGALRFRRAVRAGVATNDPFFSSALPSGSGYVLPSFWANSFLQVKAPYFVSRPHKATEKQWNRWKAPYFRISIDAEQQGVLVKLEQRLGANSVVRYATPCIWSWPQLAVKVTGGSLVHATHFQSPGRIGKHGQYTYQTPSGKGIAFSDPEEMAAGAYFPDLRAAAAAGGPRPLVSLVAEVWKAVSGLEDRGERDEPLLAVRADVVPALRGLLGARFDALLDPEVVLQESDLVAEVFGPRSERTVGGLAVRMATLEHHLAAKYGCQWSVFAAI